DALRGLIAGFPVYRTYIEEDTKDLPEDQRRYVELAVKRANDAQPQHDSAALNFVRDLLLLTPPPDMDPQGYRRAREFVMRFQQLTGPVMAKGLEDTTFYNYFPLISLNEVGREPAGFGT